MLEVLQYLMGEDDLIHQVLLRTVRLSKKYQFLRVISLYQTLFNQMNFLPKVQQLVFKLIIFIFLPFLYLLFLLYFFLISYHLELIHPHLLLLLPRYLKIKLVFILPIFNHLFFKLNLNFFNFLLLIFNQFFKVSFHFQYFKLLLFCLLQGFMF